MYSNHQLLFYPESWQNNVYPFSNGRFCKKKNTDVFDSDRIKIPK